jgi:hypothetical protein
MAEAKQFTFTFPEIAELLVKHAGVKEGDWGIFVKFGLAGSNIGDNENNLKPAAILPILELGIQRFEKPNNLTVDAAAVSKKQK